MQDLIEAGDGEGAARAVEAAVAAAAGASTAAPSSNDGGGKVSKLWLDALVRIAASFIHILHTLSNAQPAADAAEKTEEEEGEGDTPSWEAGIEVDAPDAKGLRPIHHAARRGLTVRDCVCIHTRVCVYIH